MNRKDSSNVATNHYELDDNEVPSALEIEIPPGEDNAYDSVKPSEPAASTSKSPENTLPSVVDKENKDGKTVSTSLKSFKTLGSVVCSANSTIHRVVFLVKTSLRC